MAVEGSLAETIWARGQDTAPQGRTHERPRPCTNSFFNPALKPRGRPHMIGRSDERNTPDDARVHCDAAWLLRVRSRKPSGPAVKTPHRKAGHMIAPDPAPTLS